MSAAELQSIRTALKGGRTGAVRSHPGWRRSENDSTGMTSFFLNGAASTALRTVMDGDKVVDPSFIASLTLSQLHLFIDRSVDADGHRGRVEGFSQRSVERVRIFEMACALAGVRTNTTERPETRPGRKSGLVQYQVGGTATVIAVHVAHVDQEPTRVPDESGVGPPQGDPVVPHHAERNLAGAT